VSYLLFLICHRVVVSQMTLSCSVFHDHFAEFCHSLCHFLFSCAQLHHSIYLSARQHRQQDAKLQFLPMRRYASTVLAVVMCPSDHLSQAGTVPKWQNAGSPKQHHTTAQGLIFLCQKSQRISNRVTPNGAPNRIWVG